MKRRMNRVVAVLVAAALLIGNCMAASLGSTLATSSLDVGAQTQMATGVYWNGNISARQTEHVITYTPNETVKPTVVFGDTLYGRSTMDYLADWTQKHGKTIVAGINGSFFSMTNGVPIGMVVTDGVLRSSGSNNAVGFRDDGSVVIGAPGLYVTMAYPAGDTTVINYNKSLTTVNGVVLYSRDYDTLTKNAIDAYNVIVKPVSTEFDEDGEEQPKMWLGLNDTLKLEVQYGGACYSCEIPEDGFVLSIAMDTAYKTALESMKSLKAGDVITISTETDEAWADVVYACGGDEMLVENGQAKNTFVLDSAGRRTCRTALGVREDGSTVFYTVDGLQSGYSAGLTLRELAVRMQELGCVTAINLDGGGSTILGAQYPGESQYSTINQPSDGKQRKCANFIFLTMDTESADEKELLHLYPYDAIALPNGTISFETKATDGEYRASEAPDGLTYSAEGGTMEDNVFRAGSIGTATVTVEGGGATGKAVVQIIQTPSSIAILRNGSAVNGTTIQASSGATIDFSATAKYNGISLYADDTSFTWELTGDIGTIDENGLFTAAETYESKSGVLKVSCGNAYSTVNLTVGAKEAIMTDMQNHWAREPVEALYTQGILTGAYDKEGNLVFRPDDNMTRQEFMVALIRALGIDTAQYDAIALPFDDQDQIADWALPAIRAAYANGYLNGSATGGQLLAKPTGSISRQEAMTILGRSQQLGEARDDLSAFSDSAQVADWARDYVSAMVANGVINGSNGKLNPTGMVTRAQVAKMLYTMQTLEQPQLPPEETAEQPVEQSPEQPPAETAEGSIENL